MILPSQPILVGGAAQVSLQAADGERFDSTLPAQLTGLVSAAEFQSSIARCNTAYAPSWQRWGSRLLSISGFVLWALFLGLSFQGHASGGPQPGLMFGAFACVVVLMIVGTFWGRHVERQRTERLRVAVAAESAYYNGVQRAEQFGPLHVPMSWTVGSAVAIGAIHYRGRAVMVSTIDIDLGGPMFVAAAPQPFAAQGMFVQQQQQPVAFGSVAPHPQQPYQHAAYGQPVPAPYQAPPAYSPQAQFPGEARRVGALYPQAQAHGHAHAPAPPATPAWTDEGQPFKQPVLASPSGSQAQPQQAFPSGSVWSCERCARIAQADDHFCSACGGPVARRA